MKAYMVFADAPPPGGHNASDELLVSLTYGDVVEAYDEFYRTEDAPAWDNLSAETQRQIFKAVRESGVDLDSIFDALASEF